MRILLTTHQFFPQFVAGTEILTRSVAHELIKRGHVVHVLAGHPGSASLSDEDRFDEYDFEGIHVYRFHHAYTAMGGQVSMIEVGYDNHLGADYFERILLNFKPDVVHFFHLNRLGTGLIDRVVKAGVPRFMTPTDFWTICPTGQLLLGDGSLCAGPSPHVGNCLKHLAQSVENEWLGKFFNLIPTAGVDLLVKVTINSSLLKYPKQEEVVAIVNRLPVNISRLNHLDGLLVPNKFMKEFLIRHGVEPGLIYEGAFGVDINSPIENKQYKSHQAKLRIAFIGTLAPHKGCHILIDAFKMLPDNSATLKIYGQLTDFPDYVRELKALASMQKSIDFCGTFPNSKITQIFKDIDVLVIPSIWYENTPLVLHSAQAAQCPVVVSNLPGLTEVVQQDENGLLFITGNSVDLARQLHRLISEEGLLQRLSIHARPPKSTKSYVDDLLSMWQSVK
jgi:glycosyltransferase involved in cell wall biosynthesis